MEDEFDEGLNESPDRQVRNKNRKSCDEGWWCS